MKLYADTPVRRTVQLIADLMVLVWVWLWVTWGMWVHDATMELAEPGRQIDASATDLAERLRDAGGTVSGIPLVGDEVQRPFEGAGGAADGIAGAGRAQVEAVETLALWLGLAVALIPVLMVLAVHLPLRLLFVRRATAGRRFLDAGADLDLFALRAMVHQPLHVLARLSDDPAGAWRRREPGVVDALARLELRSAGLRPPPGLTLDRVGSSGGGPAGPAHPGRPGSGVTP